MQCQVWTEGLPLEWTSSTRADGSKLIALSNNAEEPWTGVVHARSPACHAKAISCRELRSNETCTMLSEPGGVRTSPLTVAAFETAVIELGLGSCGG